MSRKYSWVYQDKLTGDLVLVMRYKTHPNIDQFRIIAGVWKRNGFRPETYLGPSVRTLDSYHFHNRYSFVGRFGNVGRPSRTAFTPGMGFVELKGAE